MAIKDVTNASANFPAITIADVKEIDTVCRILMVRSAVFPRMAPKGWTAREVPYWLLGLDPPNLTMVGYVSEGGTIMVKKNE